MPVYLTTPLAVEARQIVTADFDGKDEHYELMPGVTVVPKDRVVYVNTPEGQVIGVRGDWLVRKPGGGIFCHSPDAFAALYTPANENRVDQLMEENARLMKLLEGAPNPLPGSRWTADYIEWYYTWKRDERTRRSASAL